MKLTITVVLDRSKDLHPEDRDFSGEDCSGWVNATKQVQLLDAIYQVVVKEQKFKDHGSFYTYINGKTFTIETVSVFEFARVVIADTELLFTLLSQQAERGINTVKVENLLNNAKVILQLLSAHPAGEVLAGKAQLLEGTKLAVLITLPKGCKGIIEGFPAYEFLYRERSFVILEQRLPATIVTPIVRYNGKNLIALHTGALPEVAGKFLCAA